MKLGSTLVEMVCAEIHIRRPDLEHRFRQVMANDPQKPNESDIFYLNRIWRYQFVNLIGFDTRTERECLFVSYDNVIWFDRFRLVVLPSIIKYNLPIVGV